ncbi:MAG: helix-turn-helix domain-containing protein [Longimicrobiales bacterium]
MITIVAERALCQTLSAALPEGTPHEVGSRLTARVLRGESDLLFLQLRSGVGRSAVYRLRELMKAAPWLPIVTVISLGEDPKIVMAVGGLGISVVLTWPHDDELEAVRRLVLDHCCSALGDVVYRRLAGADPVLRSALAWATRFAHHNPTLDDLARGVGLDRRSLARHLEAGTGYTPRRIMTQGRIVQAAFRLKATGQTVEVVASAIGFSSASGLRRALRRNVGVLPSGLRVRSGLRTILEGLRWDLCGGTTVVH